MAKTLKRCSKCKVVKAVDNFWKDRSKGDGLTSSCKVCMNQVTNIYKETHHEQFRERINTYQRTLRRRNLEKVREYHKLQKRRYNRTPAGKYWNLRTRVMREGLEFNITQGEFVEWFNKQDLGCYYCGVPLMFIAGRNSDKKLQGISIDRKDNNRGYELDNMCLACRRCNTIKNSYFTEKQMLEIADKYFKETKSCV